MAAPATQTDVDRLAELLAETATMKKGEVIGELVELGVVGAEEEAIGEQTVGHLRATLAAVLLDRERRDAGTGEVQAESHDVTAEEPEVVEADAVEVDESGAEVPPGLADEVGQALALREVAPAPVSSLPSVAEFNASMAIAERIAGSTLVSSAYRGNPEDVLAAILFGREIGLGPMQSLRDIYMIDGRPALAAHRQLALLRRGGIRVLASSVTPERAWIHAQRVDTGEEMEVEWTIEEARAAGLIEKKGGNYKRHPEDMLWARAVGRLGRRLGPDLLGGLPPYTADELADFSGYGVTYGELGDLHVQRPSGRTPAPGGRTVPARETTGPERIDPKSWKEIAAVAAEYGPTLGWSEWVKDAARMLFGTEEFASLTETQRKELGRKSAAAIVALYADHEPGMFPPPDRKTVAAAWAPSLDGAILPGPMFQMSPDEAELGIPTAWEALGIDPPSRPETPPYAPSTDASARTPEAASGAEDAPEPVSRETAAMEHVEAHDEYEAAGDEVEF